MNEQQFAYWLQGFAELTGDTPPTVEQWKSIREHLATVFVKVTPLVESTKLDDARRMARGFQLAPGKIEDIIREAQKNQGISPFQPYQPYFLGQDGQRHPATPGTAYC